MKLKITLSKSSIRVSIDVYELLHGIYNLQSDTYDLIACMVHLLLSYIYD